MKITMEHGSGGRATSELIEQVFAKHFNNDILNQMEDSAVVAGSSRIAVTTDSFVVNPLEFPGGNIGRLCICGTVNDLLMRGARAKYITCGFIIEEGAEFEILERIAASMAETAIEAGVIIIAGDTKVIEGNGGIYINTTGVGFVEDEIEISAHNIRVGDAVILSGTVGEHHAAILSERMGIENDIVSDNAPLNQMVYALIEQGIEVHALRDVTRGGLATVLKELAKTTDLNIELEETKLPVTAKVKDFCGLLGLEPLYMGNEGKLVALVAPADAEKALDIIRHSKYGENAAIIGIVNCDESGQNGLLKVKTEIGGVRILDVLQGEGLPRIC